MYIYICIYIWVMVMGYGHPSHAMGILTYLCTYIYIFQWIDHARTQKKALLFLTTKWHISHPTGPTAPQLMASAKAREWSSTKALALKSHRENV
jgi:Ca2+/Na+ antiporter